MNDINVWRAKSLPESSLVQCIACLYWGKTTSSNLTLKILQEKTTYWMRVKNTNEINIIYRIDNA